MSSPTHGQADLGRLAMRVETLASDLRAAVADVSYYATYAGPTAPSTRAAQSDVAEAVAALRGVLDRIDDGAL